MAVNFFAPMARFRNLVVTDGGSISSDNGNMSTDGNGNLTVGSITEGVVTTAPQTLATGNTITLTPNKGVMLVTTAAAVTGIILPAGTVSGQNITIVHEGAAANTITFAAAGTSNVADGVSDVITGPSAREFQWVSATALWYPVH
jgi:hypothetical protein